MNLDLKYLSSIWLEVHQTRYGEQHFPNFCCIYLIGKKIYPTLQIFHQILTKNCF